MALLLDTDDVEAGARTDALRQVVDRAIMPSRVRLDSPGGAGRARVHAFGLGPGLDLVTISTAGSESTMGQREASWAGGRGALRLLDLTSSYRFSQLSRTSSQACYADADRLGLPVGLVRRAAPRLPASPLYPLVRQHLVALGPAAAQVEGTPAASFLGDATLDLLRALVVTAAPDDGLRTDVLADTLFLRAGLFIRERLADPGLTPALVAAGHGVSLRHLQRVFAGRGTSVWEEIVSRRLEGARRELAVADSAGLVGAVGRRWGFPDARHFARRFRAAFGVSPREWQRASGVT